MADILDEIRTAQDAAAMAATADYAVEILGHALMAAYDEIERLRGLAGVVTPGPSLADIKRDG